MVPRSCRVVTGRDRPQLSRKVRETLQAPKAMPASGGRRRDRPPLKSPEVSSQAGWLTSLDPSYQTLLNHPGEPV